MKRWTVLAFCSVLAACAETHVDAGAGQADLREGQNEASNDPDEEAVDLRGSGGRTDDSEAREREPERRDAGRYDPPPDDLPVDPDDAGLADSGPAFEWPGPQRYPIECDLESDREPVTLTVPTDYDSIQAAIDAAQPLDTVKVLPGTYDESLQLKTGVRLVGSGAESTILDGGQRSKNLIDFTEAHDVVVSGFTLRNVGQGVGCADPDDVLRCGGYWYASAVYADGHTYWSDEDPCNDASILLSDNIITGNYVGLMLDFWPIADVRNNVFVDNRAAFVASHHGGSTGLLAHNLFVDNGEAVAMVASFFDLVDNVFVGNDTVLRQEACQHGVQRCNVVWNNGSLGERFLIGADDNISADPLLEVSGSSYGFAPGSPALDRPCAADTVPFWYDGCPPE